MNPNQESPSELLSYCRVGFELDAHWELAEFVSKVSKDLKFEQWDTGPGYVLASKPSRPITQSEWRSLLSESLIFSRAQFQTLDHCEHLPEKNKLDAILRQAIPLLIQQNIASLSEVIVEAPNTEDKEDLGRFCTMFLPHATKALEKQSLIQKQGMASLRLVFLSYEKALIALGLPNVPALGIHRIRFDAASPSRSWLKIAEAMETMLSPHEKKRRLKSGMSAVDMGAAPGGWTYFLAKEGLKVWAIDRAKLAPKVASMDSVIHMETNAFQFRPPKGQVDWVVCDMVDDPKQVLGLMRQWLHEGWCKQALFNLKLPDHKRFQNSKALLAELNLKLNGKSKQWNIKARQLYHDRREITVLVTPFVTNQGGQDRVKRSSKNKRK